MYFNWMNTDVYWMSVFKLISQFGFWMTERGEIHTSLCYTCFITTTWIIYSLVQLPGIKMHCTINVTLLTKITKNTTIDLNYVYYSSCIVWYGFDYLGDEKVIYCHKHHIFNHI